LFAADLTTVIFFAGQTQFFKKTIKVIVKALVRMKAAKAVSGLMLPR
jgi:hypothetical protein